MEEALSELESPVRLVDAEDGSGCGAALVANLSVRGDAVRAVRA